MIKTYEIIFSGTSRDDRDMIPTRMTLKTEIVKSTSEEKVKKYAKKKMETVISANLGYERFDFNIKKVCSNKKIVQ